MVAAAWAGAEDADLVLLVIDAAAKLGQRAETILEGIKDNSQPLMIVLNKVDIARKEDLLTLATQLSERLNPRHLFMVSATTGAFAGEHCLGNLGEGGLQSLFQYTQMMGSADLR